MGIDTVLNQMVRDFFLENHSFEIETIEFQPTRKEFNGDITIVVFPFLKYLKINLETLGTLLGNHIVSNSEFIESFNVVKGFLNLTVADSYYIDQLNLIIKSDNFGIRKATAKSPVIVVEFSSPNTNKPLHLGHVRNNLLGFAVSNILEANGNKVIKTQIINDRGIHICKSMVAWKNFGAGETPESSGSKGDRLVGKYYVRFEKEYKFQTNDLIERGFSEETAKRQAPVFLEAQKMLRLWEAGDAEVCKLWAMMNQWVYEGFEETYKNMGVHFDSYYYESETYLQGKRIIEEGLSKCVFYKKEDGSVWIDLTEDGLDEKLLLRSDGTSVYMTQDLGTALLRYENHPEMSGMIYTVGNEQDYHFKVLFLILKKLGYSWADELHHLSYGMVDLPSGKMKSREGTVVDADDLIAEMQLTAKKISEEAGKVDDLTEEEWQGLSHIIGLGALKYYILKVDPKKRILFNPEESVDFNGNTGPFIQYTHARIKTLLAKSKMKTQKIDNTLKLDDREKIIIKLIMDYPKVLTLAAEQLNPALIANYVYDLVKAFNSFYQNIPILGSTSKDQKQMRIQLSAKVAEVISQALGLLGIQVPDRM